MAPNGDAHRPACRARACGSTCALPSAVPRRGCTWTASASRTTSSHTTANINEAGDLARDPFISPTHTSFNGAVAEAAIWTAALTNDECLALAKRLSPLQLKHRLHSLVLYKDLMRELNRGIGPALSAVNSPSVVPHPPLIYPACRPQPSPRAGPFSISLSTVVGDGPGKSRCIRRR